MSETSQNRGDRFIDHLDGLREALGDTPDYSWPEYLVTAFGVDKQPAFVDFGGTPDCGHPECTEDFWEDGPDLSTVDFVASVFDAEIERAKQSHPASGERPERRKHRNPFVVLHRIPRVWGEF